MLGGEEMAQSVGGLYLSLGLNLSELETGFVTASQTVAANIARLNRESNLVRLRAEVEIAGLDETADAERILQIRQTALNRQMEIQRDRVRILDAEFRNLVQTQGENSIVAQRAAIRLERERLTLANLDNELRNLNETSGGSNGFFGELSEMLPSIPTKLQAIGVAFGAVTAGVGAAATATKELLNEFHELQNQAYELNMSFTDTRNFLREMRLAGGDIGDFEGYIRGISDAYVKGEWDDPEFIALRKYGAEITDATGRLKNFKDLTEEVYQAWLKADAAGEGIEFLQLTGGEAGVRDAIQYFQRLKEAREDADKISTAKIDEKQLHELDRTMNLVTEQSAELKAALGDIFTPAAQAAAEKFFQILHDGTQTLVDNKDALQKWQFVAAEIFDTIADKASKVSDKIAEIAKTPKGTTGNVKADKIMSDMGWRYQDFNQQTPWRGNEPWKNFPKPESNHVLDGIYQRAEEKQKAYNAELEETAKKIDELDKKADNNPLNQYALKRVQQFRDELEDLQIELDFGGKDYLKSLAQLDLWKKRESVYKNFLSDEEKKVIDDLYSAKLDQIKQEQAEKIQEHWDNAADIQYEMTHTAFEKELRDIERWKEAQQEKASTAEEVQAVIAESAAKEAQAFEREMDRIKGTLQSLEDKIFEQEHSQYENDLRRAQQERIRYYEDFQKKGILNADTAGQIERWYNNAVNKLKQQAAKGGDYLKSPEGAMQRGGNGIMVIGGDQIIDDGLKNAVKANIGVIADESKFRAQFSQGLSQSAKEFLAANQSARQLTEAQKELIQSTQQAASGFQLIEGDKFTNVPQAPQAVNPQQQGYQVIEADQVVSMPTEQIQQFGDAVQQTANAIEQSDPSKILADAQKSLADNVSALPPEYFQNLADGTKAVSDMQLALTKSTMNLKDKFDALATKLESLSTVNQSRDNNQQSDGVLKLSASTQNLNDAQNALIRTTRDVDRNLRDISDIPPQTQLAQKDSGFKVGFDYDTAKDLMLTGVGLAATAGATGVGLAFSPEILAGAIVAALGGGLLKGTYDENTQANNQPDDRLKPVGEVDLSALDATLATIDTDLQSVLQELQNKSATETGIDFTELITPLTAIDEKAQGILQALQDTQPYQFDGLQEFLGTLPNIEEYVKSVLLELQSRNELPADTNAQLPNTNGIDYLTPLTNIDTNLQNFLQSIQTPQETAFSMETVVTPLNNIARFAENISTALGNRQPAQITVSPNISVNLGGAYVFDNAMKNELTNDITQDIVDEITTAVRQATSQSNYGYGA